MSESTIGMIIVAAIAFLGTVAGSYFANRKQSALIAYRLEQLERKVDKHNSVIERTYALEKRADVFEERQKVANNRIKDLEATHENRLEQG